MSKVKELTVIKFIKDDKPKFIHLFLQKLYNLRKSNVIKTTALIFFAFNVTDAQAGTHGHMLFIDCSHAEVGKEWTGSSIKIRFLSKHGNNLGTYKLHSSETSESSCTSINPLKYNNQVLSNRPLDQFWRKVLDVRLDGYARSIIIETGGSDGFLIDALGLWIDGSPNKYWGQDDVGAWCLSNDKTDANKGWKKIVGENACYTAIHFKAEHGKYARSYGSLID